VRVRVSEIDEYNRVLLIHKRFLAWHRTEQLAAMACPYPRSLQFPFTRFLGRGAPGFALRSTKGKCRIYTGEVYGVPVVDVATQKALPVSLCFVVFLFASVRGDCA